MKKNQVCLFIYILLILCKTQVFSQEKQVVDQVVAIVGNSIILKSDIYNQKIQYEAQQDIDLGDDPFCEMLEEALYQKLLYDQAIIDSVEIPEEQVEATLEQRLNYFIRQIGSEEKLEEYYGRSISELKDNFRDIIREQKLSQQMESKITSDVRATPSDVRNYYNNLPEDEIPVVESQIELSHIVKKPPMREEEIQNAKSRLNRIRERVKDGDDFSTLAIMYSDDPGSARRGGELGFIGRGELFGEFEAVVFNLEPGQVSEVFETPVGYHIAEKIERRGERINIRHILIRPEISPQDLRKTKNKLDSIKNLIERNVMSFGEAAKKFSEHPSSINEGVMINPYTGTTRFSRQDLDRDLSQVVERMNEGEVTGPVEMMTEEGEQAFRLIHLRNRTEPSKASLQENYDYIKRLTLEKKKNEKIEEWIKNKIQKTYLHIIDEYKDCSFSHDWLKKHLTAE